MGVNFGQYVGHEILSEAGKDSTNRIIDAYKTKIDNDQEDARLLEEKRKSEEISSGYQKEIVKGQIVNVLDANKKPVRTNTADYQDQNLAIQKTNMLGFEDSNGDGIWNPGEQKTASYDMAGKNLDISQTNSALQQSNALGYKVDYQGKEILDADGNRIPTLQAETVEKERISNFIRDAKSSMNAQGQSGPIIDPISGDVLVEDYNPISAMELQKSQNLDSVRTGIADLTQAALKDGNIDFARSIIEGNGIAKYIKDNDLKSIDPKEIENLQEQAKKDIANIIQKIEGDYMYLSVAEASKMPKDVQDTYKHAYRMLNGRDMPTGNVVAEIMSKRSKVTDIYGTGTDATRWSKKLIKQSDDSTKFWGKDNDWDIGGSSKGHTLPEGQEVYLKGTDWTDNESMLVAAMKQPLTELTNTYTGTSDLFLQKDGDGQMWLGEDDPLENDWVRLQLGSKGPEVLIEDEWIPIGEAIDDLHNEFGS